MYLNKICEQTTLHQSYENNYNYIIINIMYFIILLYCRHNFDGIFFLRDSGKRR